MTKHFAAAIALILSLGFGSVAWAQQGRPAGHPPVPGRSSGMPDVHDRILKEVEPTEKQVEPLKKILNAHRKEMAAWMGKAKPEAAKLQQQVQRFRTDKGPEAAMAAKAAMARLDELRAEQKKLTNGLLAKLSGVLDEKQVAQAREIIDPAPPAPRRMIPFHLLGKLDLTTEQIAQAEKLITEARTAGKGKSPVETDDLLQKAWDGIGKDVLTDKQRKTLDEIQTASQRRVVRAMLGGIDLTDEQYEQIAAIWKSAQAKAEKDPRSRMDIHQRANQQVIENVLTPEQQKQVQSGRKWHGGGENPHHKGSPMDTGGQKPLPKGQTPLPK